MNTKGNILFITQWQFNDALIQTYTLPYVSIIKEINSFNNYYLIVFNKSIRSINRFEHDGIQIIELPYEFITFRTFLPIYLKIKRIVVEQSISHLHPWCTTAGAFGGLLKKYHNRNLKLVIDSFEPHAEAMVENGEWSRTSLKYRFLIRLEAMQAKQADRLIFAAEGMQNYIKLKYDALVSKFDVKPACVDLELFKPNRIEREKVRNELNLADNIVCIYAGKLGGIYLDKEIFVFAKQCHLFWGDKFRFLLLSAMPDEELNAYCKQFEIPEYVFVKRFVPHKKVASMLNAADFGLCPVKPIPSKRYCSPIKNGEYWAMGLPVIITEHISTDSDLIRNKKIGAVWKQQNQEEFLRSIVLIDKLINNRPEELKSEIRDIAREYRGFEIAKQVYRKIYYICEST